MNAVRHLIINNDIKVLDIQIADLPGIWESASLRSM